MGAPTISQARRICEALKVRGVIILAFDEEAVGGASYGETKAECADLRKLLDWIVDEIQKGRREV